MADKTDPKKKNPYRFGEPEKTNWLRVFVYAAFVVIMLSAIVWMVASNPHQHPLTCQANGAGSWSSFGRCTEN